MKLSTGEIYTGDFEYDLMNGEGEMEYSKTMRYKGSWKNNLVSDYTYMLVHVFIRAGTINRLINRY